MLTSNFKNEILLKRRNGEFFAGVLNIFWHLESDKVLRYHGLFKNSLT